jgi:hypothetical protein
MCCGSIFVGHPGSGSVSQRDGSGSFYHQVKIASKTLIPTLVTSSLKNDGNVPSKRNKQKNVEQKLVFCWYLEGQ